jgi:hypothetical protein
MVSWLMQPHVKWKSLAFNLETCVGHFPWQIILGCDILYIYSLVFVNFCLQSLNIL